MGPASLLLPQLLLRRPHRRHRKNRQGRQIRRHPAPARHRKRPPPHEPPRKGPHAPHPRQAPSENPAPRAALHLHRRIPRGDRRGPPRARRVRRKDALRACGLLRVQPGGGHRSVRPRGPGPGEGQDQAPRPPRSGSAAHPGRVCRGAAGQGPVGVGRQDRRGRHVGGARVVRRAGDRFGRSFAAGCRARDYGRRQDRWTAHV
mmetsp:Transcript_20692/g.51000  ORF Transcript_20692/g.51000 Transcript_20692/m.51000 type:complete len:203 (-) Transcript_20692:661-1269(-)